MHCTKFSGNNAKNIQQCVETNVNVVFFHVPIFIRGILVVLVNRQILYTNNLTQQNCLSRSKEHLKFAIRCCYSFFQIWLNS